MLSVEANPILPRGRHTIDEEKKQMFKTKLLFYNHESIRLKKPILPKLTTLSSFHKYRMDNDNNLHKNEPRSFNSR